MNNKYKVNHYNKILDLSQKTGVPVALLMNILTEAASITPDNSTFITKTGISKTILALIKKELSSYFVPVNGKTKLSEYGQKALEQINSQTKLEAVLDLKKVEEILSTRPSAERNYDQFLATQETVISRLKLMDYLGDLRQKKILFIGDDDFMSVITAVYGDPAEISVLEIDKRITTQIRKLSDKYNLNIKILLHDVKKNLPSEYISQFDVVFTDPPYTSNGVKLFLSRAIQTLYFHNKAARIYFCYGNSDLAREKFVEIQKIVSDSGLMIRSVIDKFNRYSGAESIGSASSLFICDTTPMSKSLVKGEFNANIYTND